MANGVYKPLANNDANANIAFYYHNLKWVTMPNKSKIGASSTDIMITLLNENTDDGANSINYTFTALKR